MTERTGFSGRAMYIYCINDNGCPRPKAIGETEDKAIENWNLRFDFAQTPKDTMKAALESALEYVESDLRERFSVSGQNVRDEIRAALSDTSTDRQ